jgi:DNA ligase D-like protein (predicted ligase)
MLARLGSAFDSDEHWFEIKWDGMRSLVFAEGSRCRLQNRRGEETLALYPELEFLSELPQGTVLDGEVVALVDGRPDFHLLMSRAQGAAPQGARARSARARSGRGKGPGVHYIAFDLLYEGYASLMERPLRERRERLSALLGGFARERLVLSDGVEGAGRAFFEAACGRELEGIVAKRLSGPYLPGQRNGDWVKIKRAERLPCAIIGYLADRDGTVRSLVLASAVEGDLRCVGRAGSGLTARMRVELTARLEDLRRSEPIVDCGPAGELPGDAIWVEPELYCLVSYLEKTHNGSLRAPVFLELLAQ